MPFLGFFDYNKPGKGISKDAPRKKSFFLFFELYFRKFTKLVQLNLLYILCCLPIVTIGPATAGFVYVLRNFSREEHAWVVSDFFGHAKKNFLQAFLVSIINLFAYYIMYVSFYLYGNLQAISAFSWARVVIVLVFCLYTIVQFFVYPIMVTFKLNLRGIFKNALIFTFAELPKNFLVLLSMIAVLVAFFYDIRIGVVLTPFIVLSTIGFIATFYGYRIVYKYMVVGNPEAEAQLDRDYEEPVAEDRG